MISLYTDGSYRRLHNCGGWAFFYQLDNREIKSSGWKKETTSNQMEILAVIEGFKSMLKEQLSGKRILVVSDSTYVIYGATRWIYNWKVNGWKTAEKANVLNRGLWEEVDELASRFKTRWQWVRGHDGHPVNELVDRLATAASSRAIPAIAQGLVSSNP